MEDEEFLGSLTSAWLGEERRAAPRESLFEKVVRLGPEAMRGELDPIIDHYDALAVYLPEATELADALDTLREKLDEPSCSRVEELYARHAETVRSELAQLEVRVTYSPWVDGLKAQLQAFVRGQQPRAPILEALAELEEQLAVNFAKNDASTRALGSQADETSRQVFALSARGYGEGGVAARELALALERRDIEGAGEALRALNDAFSYLTQAKELCQLYARREA